MKKGLHYGRVLTDDDSAVLASFRADLPLLEGLGLDVVRIDCGLKGAEDWTSGPLLGRLQWVADTLDSKGMAPLLLLPVNAVAGATAADWQAPAGSAAFTAYTARLVANAVVLAEGVRWAAGIEVTNEPNAPGGGYLAPEALAPLLHAAHEAIKAARPGLPVLCGGLFAHNNHGARNDDNAGATYLAQLQAAITAQQLGHCYSALGYHPYLDQPGRFDPAHLADYLQRLASHTGAPLWLTEGGWQSTAVGPEEQAANLAAYWAACRQSAQIALCCTFSLRDSQAAGKHYGLVTEDGAKKPAYATWAGFSG